MLLSPLLALAPLVQATPPAARLDPSGKTVELATETEDTRQLAEVMRDELSELGIPQTPAAFEDGRSRLLALLAEVESLPGTLHSRLLSEVCHDVGTFALQAQMFDVALRALEVTLAFRELTLPPGDVEIETVRGGIGHALLAAGDARGALPYMESVHEALTEALPEDDPRRLIAMQNLAVTFATLGMPERGVVLEEEILALRERTLPADHPELLSARSNLAATLGELGELDRAAALLEDVVADYERTLPEEHIYLQRARMNLGRMVGDLGDRQRGLDLELRALLVYERVLPADHPELELARINVASSLQVLGDYRGARDILEKVLASLEGVYPDDHPDLQRARMNLAGTLQNLGDREGARALMEKAVEMLSRGLGPDHLDVQRARMNLAMIRRDLGDLEGAVQLCQAAMEVLDESVAAGNPVRREVGHQLASLLFEQGRLDESRALLEELIAASPLPPDHIELHRLRTSLSSALVELGELDAALALQQDGLEALEATLAPHDLEVRRARRMVIRTLVALDRFEEATAEALELSRVLAEAGSSLVLEHAPRELESIAASFEPEIGALVSLALGVRGHEPGDALVAAAFRASESSRSHGLGAARATARASLPATTRARARLADASAELARLVREGAETQRLADARLARDAARREIAATLGEAGSVPALRIDRERVARALAGDRVGIAYRRCKLDVWPEDVQWPRGEEHLVAFAIGGGGALQVVDLGPAAAVERAVDGWRTSMGVGAAARGVQLEDEVGAGDERARGSELRELVWTPVLRELGDAARAVVVPDDVLHLVPLDALPSTDGGRLGDRLAIETRTSLLELVAPPPRAAAPPALVALGGVDYDDAPPAARDASDATADTAGRGAYASLRSPTAAFTGLPGAALEAREIAEIWKRARGETATLLEGAAASRDALAAVARKATHIHLATHGWFAPESVPSTVDAEPVDASLGVGSAMTAREQVAGTAPMLLCGIALAGANRAPDRLGRVPGLLTAEELASWSLSGCELAVLSACDTSLGLRRAGNGVASLQSALHQAGVRTTLTSLWKVPDEATRSLMVAFYRAMLLEGEPPGRALWEAKAELRDLGHPVRDWGGWVLTGEPD